MGGGLEGLHFLRPEFDFELLHDAGTADDGGHAEADAANAVGALDLAGDGEHALAVEGDAVDDFFDGHADGPTGAAFAGDDFGAALLRALENFRLERGSDAGEFQQREAVHRGRRPDRQHAVAVFAEDHGAHLRGGELQFRGDERAEARAVEHGAETDDLLPREAEAFGGELGEDVDRIGNNEDDGALFQSGLLEAVEDAVEESDVAVDEIETGFVRLAAESGGDADEVGRRAVGVGACVDVLVGAIGRAVQQVEGLAFGGGLIGVEDDEVFHDPGALQGEGGATADAAAAADDGYFHDGVLGFCWAGGTGVPPVLSDRDGRDGRAP